MGRLLEELDYRPTAMGPLVLRRRWVAAIDTDVVEVILGDEHLMSSLFTVGETELAVRGLASASGTRPAWCHSMTGASASTTSTEATRGSASASRAV